MSCPIPERPFTMRHLLVVFMLAMLFPFSLLAQSDECAAALDNRVKAATYGRVTLGGSANRVRSAPSTEADTVFNLPPGYVFYVPTDPVCDGAIRWLPIDVDGRRGWTAESAGGPDYFVEPVFGVQTLTDTLTLDVDANALAFSPDGQTLYAVSGTNTLTTVTLPDGGISSQQLSFIDGDDTPLNGFFEDPWERGYITLHEDSAVFWNLNLQMIERVRPESIAEVETVNVSANGDWVGFGGCTEGCAEAVVEVQHRVTGERYLLEAGGDRVTDMVFLIRQRTYTDEDEDFVQWLVSLTADGNRRIFDLTTGRWDMFSEHEVRLSRANTLIMTVPELIMYGGCADFDNAGDCARGRIASISWQSGGGRGAFAPVEDGAFTDLIFSPISTSRDRVIGLVDSAYVAAFDYDGWGEGDANRAEMTVFDDIVPRAMALSPAGDVLAVVGDGEIWLYDMSVAVDPFYDSLWPAP
jgi:WD40 repeat protein